MVFFASLQYSLPSVVFLQQHFETVLLVREHVIAAFLGAANNPVPTIKPTIAAATAVLVYCRFLRG